MKKLLMAGTVVLAVALLFMLTPNTQAGASATDFVMEGTTLVDYTGTGTNVSIPDTVKTIGRSAFENNTTVKKIIISDSVETIEEYAFWGCSSLETVVFGEGLYEIGDFTFTACEKLKEVSISDSVRRIGIMAFADCTSLTDIYIPATVTDIHSTAFDGVNDLNIQAQEYSYPYEYAIARGENVAKASESLQTVVQPEIQEAEIVATPQPASTLQPAETPQSGVVIGSTTIVGNSAVVFMDSEDMETIKGYEGLISAEVTTQPQKQRLEDWTYYGTTSLVNMELGENIATIGRFAFARSSLESVVLPEGLETIEYAAFYYCENLDTIIIPDTVTYIGEKAFDGTPWLQSFYDGTMILEENSDFLIVGDGVLIAYRGTDTNVTIPEGVKYIVEDAFSR